MPFDKLLKRARGSRSSSTAGSAASSTASSDELERGDAFGLREWVIPRAALQLHARIGKGSFGSVHRCVLSGEEEQHYVAKQISPLRTKPEDRSCLVNEMHVWSSVKHPNCVAFRGVVFGPKERDDYFLLCELMPGGSVHDRLVRRAATDAPPPKRAVLNREMLQVASAMMHLHSLGIIHRDLKSSNVLIGKDGRLAVSDFGLARYTHPDGEMTAETGSYRWMAPEVIRHEKYGCPCDVYSYGLFCYELLSNRVPYADMAAVAAALRVARFGIRPDLPASAPSDVCEVIKSCWQQDPRERPTFTSVCASLEALRASLTVHGDADDATPATPTGSPPSTDHGKRGPAMRDPAGHPRPQRRASAPCATLDPKCISKLALSEPSGL